MSRTWAKYSYPDTVAGDPWSLMLRFKNEAGDLLDKTGYSYQGAMRARTTGEVVETMTVDTSRAAQGEIVFSLTGDQTRNFPRRTVGEIQEAPLEREPMTLLRITTVFEREIV